MSLLFGDLYRRKSGWVGFESSLGGVREVCSIALRELIDSELESGREFFILCTLFDGSAFLRKLACSGRP